MYNASLSERSRAGDHINTSPTFLHHETFLFNSSNDKVQMYITGTKCCLPTWFFLNEKIPDGFSLSKRLLNWWVFFIRWTFDDWCYMYYSGRINMNWNINFTFMSKVVLNKTVVEWFSSFKKTHVNWYFRWDT